VLPATVDLLADHSTEAVDSRPLGGAQQSHIRTEVPLRNFNAFLMVNRNKNTQVKAKALGQTQGSFGPTT
jgi:hypothetical protein